MLISSHILYCDWRLYYWDSVLAADLINLYIHLFVLTRSAAIVS